jgi:hypothetical protein
MVSNISELWQLLRGMDTHSCMNIYIAAYGSNYLDPRETDECENAFFEFLVIF